MLFFIIISVYKLEQIKLLEENDFEIPVAFLHTKEEEKI